MKEMSRFNIGLTMLGAVLLVVGYGAAASAQTATPGPSDYAIDVQAGQAAIQSDPVVASNAKEVNDSESDKGGVDNEPAEVKEAVEPKEATEAVESNSGESSGGQSGGGESSGGQSGGGESSGGQSGGGESSGGQSGGQR